MNTQNHRQPLINDPSIQAFEIHHPYTMMNEEPPKTAGSLSVHKQNLSSRNQDKIQNLYRVILPKMTTTERKVDIHFPYEEVSRNKSQGLFQRTLDKFTNQNLNDWVHTQKKLAALTNRKDPETQGTPLMVS